MNEVLKQIEKLRIVPVVVLEDSKDAAPLAKALVDGGLPCAEVTFRTEAAEESIRIMAEKYPDMLIGAGTILTTDQVDRAVNSGAKFIVSPGFNSKVVDYCIEKNIPITPGVSTPSEIEAAIEKGLEVVKFFPAEQSGGLPFLKAVSAPYNKLKFMPTGGINPENVKDYLAFDKIIACGGSWMVKGSFVKNKEFDKITELTKEAVKIGNGQDTDDNAKNISQKPLSEKVPLAVEVSKSLSEVNNTYKKYDLLSLGELLLRLSPSGDNRLVTATNLETHLGGAEMNVAAGASLLGLKTGVLTKLPDNDIGSFAKRIIDATCTDTSNIIYDNSDDARLGLYFFENGAYPRKPSVVYDRKYSSFCKLEINEIPESLYSSTKCFHTSGITLALGGKVRETAIEMIKRFKKAGALISFDVNFRGNLWSGPEAKECIETILPYVDYFFCSEDTARLTFLKEGSVEDIMRSFAHDYPLKLVISTKRTVHSPKIHSFNSVIYNACEDKFYKSKPYENINVVDRIGSGDSYVSGALYGLLKDDLSIKDAVDYGNACAALKATVIGDMGISDKREVDKIIKDHLEDNTLEINR